MSNMFQDQIIVAKFHRITPLKLRQGMKGILIETANGLVTGFVAIPCVIFFPVYIYCSRFLSCSEKPALFLLYSVINLRFCFAAKWWLRITQNNVYSRLSKSERNELVCLQLKPHYVVSLNWFSMFPLYFLLPQLLFSRSLEPNWNEINIPSWK